MGSGNNKRNNKSVKKFTTRMQQTLLLFFCGIIILVILLIFVMVKIHQQDGDRYEKRVLNQQTYVSSTIPYKRGDILDRNGTVIATSKKVYNLVLDVKLLVQNEKYLEPTLQAVSEHFGIDREELNTVVKEKPNKSYVVLRKEIDADTVMTFEEKMKEKGSKIKGVWFEEKYKRTYPLDTLASSMIGFSNTNNVASGGLELYYSDELNGVNGREYGYFDSNLDLVRTVKKPQNGHTIVTTLDANVQRIVQEEIQRLNKETPSKNVGVIVMDPNNGEILAMASDKEYNLNDPYNLDSYYTKAEQKAMSEKEKQEILYGIWRNYCISDTFEPGSTFKPFTIASALEEGIITKNSDYVCDGYELIPGGRIRCSKRAGHGHITLTESLMYSCNDVMMQIAEEEGRNIFYRYQNHFLFGSKTNIDLPGEAPGILKPESELNVSELATSSFGQTFNTSMIQIASGFSSLVNGGYYYEPHLLKQMETSSGAVVSRNDGILVKETISKDTSNFLKQALYHTVEDGTAKGAKVKGYAIGGKTGTAQKFPRTDGKYVLSFVGAVPMDDPEVVIYVTIDEYSDETKKANSGVATEFTSKILSRILPFLNVYPEGEIDYSVLGVEPLKKEKEKNDKESKNNNDSEANIGENDLGDKVDWDKVVNNPTKDEYNANVLPDEEGSYSYETKDDVSDDKEASGDQEKEDNR